MQSNLEKSLGPRFDGQIDQKMGTFQASMMEAFSSLREDFQKSLQKSKQLEVDQTSSSAHNQTHFQKIWTNPRNLVVVLLMEVEYGPDLPPRLDPYDSRIEDASGHLHSPAEEPSRVASARPKQSSHASKHYDVDPSSALDHKSDYLNDPQPAPTTPKISDKSKHKSRARFLPSSSGLKCEAEMTLLQPQLGETRCQELRNASFWPSSLFKSQLVKEGEDFLL